jgi:Ca-activated chloride channel family protein
VPRAVSLAAALALSAQLLAYPGKASAPQSADTRPFTSTTRIVALTVVVQNGQAHYVPGLTRQDFAVFEDGMRQDVRLFEAGSLPLDLILLLDTSESMTGEIETAQAAAHGLLSTLRKNDRAAVVLFNQRIRTLAPLTSNERDLANAIAAAHPIGSTALHDAVHAALAQYGRRALDKGEIRRQAIVVLSDGEDTSSRYTFDDVLNLARTSGVTIYTVRLHDPEDYSRLLTPGMRKRAQQADRDMRTLASETGALSFFPEPRQLRDVYAGIATELASQYSIGYEPSARTDGDRFHAVRVEIVNRPDLRARTRAGYLESGK